MAAATLSLVAAGLAIAGAAMGTYSAIQKSNAEENAAEYNRAMASQQAGIASAEAEADAKRADNRTRRLVASQRAQFAKNGGSLSGSALDVLFDTALQGELDSATIRYKGARAANEQMNAANLYKMQARSIKKERTMVIAGSILGGLGNSAGAAAGGRY